MVDETVEGTKPEEGKEPESVKTVPLSDLITFKNASKEREKKLKAQLDEATRTIAELNVDLDVVRKSGGSDEEVEEVKKFLTEERKKIAGIEAKVKQEQIAIEKREKAIRAKELSTEYKIDLEALEGEEDIEGTALKLYAERLAKENEELKQSKSPAPTVYESSPGGTSKKMPRDMTPAELKEYEKRELAKTMAKR